MPASRDCDSPRMPNIPPIATMMAGEIEPLDLVTIRATVRRALQVRPRPPRAAEVHEITSALRGHLSRMVRVARSRVDELERGTMAWIQWTALINRAQDDLNRAVSSGTLPAASYMDDLGRTCRRLADCLDE
ncbi:hypothetical protein I5Q34_16530 [Streptomyces sp. AV19]|uniref:DUF6415 family natural product biosynthesis protein n=1 Tax=Streptomyces sp. AV19 TaxID=2793068 RepID=UPI0018FE127A|nr:DUF6415 family natural product biosynthesis protein [Streptomyces sp. AV19]MBH1935854.1 hypothetical protein [Streptomyces sp. AV19]MDG4534362.1 DUF6415 family natural product biosynthesis protein [Streptomyces sp. AV19]